MSPIELSWTAKNTLYFLCLLSLENISFAFLYDDVCVKVFNRIVTFPLLQVGRTQNEQYNIYLEMSNIQFWLKRIPSIRVSFWHHRCFNSHNSLRGIHSIHPLHSTPLHSDILLRSLIKPYSLFPWCSMVFLAPQVP